MDDRTWLSYRDPANAYASTVILGQLTVRVPADAIISATRSERLSVGRLILNALLNQFIQRELHQMPGLLYAQLKVDRKQRWVQTMLVWSDRELAACNQSGVHSFTRRLFGWVLMSGDVHHYSLHWPANGTIPTANATELTLKQDGKMYVGGRPVRSPAGSDEAVEGVA